MSAAPHIRGVPPKIRAAPPLWRRAREDPRCLPLRRHAGEQLCSPPLWSRNENYLSCPRVGGARVVGLDLTGHPSLHVKKPCVPHQGEKSPPVLLPLPSSPAPYPSGTYLLVAESRANLAPGTLAVLRGARGGPVSLLTASEARTLLIYLLGFLNRCRSHCRCHFRCGDRGDRGDRGDGGDGGPAYFRR